MGCYYCAGSDPGWMGGKGEVLQDSGSALLQGSHLFLRSHVLEGTLWLIRMFDWFLPRLSQVSDCYIFIAFVLSRIRRSVYIVMR